MPERIVWTDQAKADIRDIEQQIAIQILRTLARFAKTGVGDTRQMVDIDPPLFRLRAQSHRVFYRSEEDQILILRVLDRKEAYR